MNAKTYLIILLVLLFGASIFSWASDKSDETSLSFPAENIKWSKFPNEDGFLQGSPVIGDFNNGKHGTFVKLPAHFDSPVHFHTADFYGVVVKGEIINRRVEAKQETILKSGSYWFQKGKAVHITRCVSDEDCVIFVSQPDSFDYIPEEKKEEKKQ